MMILFWNKYSWIWLILLMTCNNIVGQENAIPQFPEWMIKQRIETLNQQSPIKLELKSK